MKGLHTSRRPTAREKYHLIRARLYVPDLLVVAADKRYLTVRHRRTGEVRQLKKEEIT